MDDRLFDLWTRRRLGILTGTAATTLLSLALPGASAAKKRKRKRCTKLRKPCHIGGRKCCHHNACVSIDTGANGTFFCCKPENKDCQTSDECCPGTACFKEAPSETGFCKIT
jgi:hypothetical protein